ncbi:MAG TPA: hypothetical protein VGC91_16295 [Pyrinomonadaceae bacterium]
MCAERLYCSRPLQYLYAYLFATKDVEVGDGEAARRGLFSQPGAARRGVGGSCESVGTSFARQFRSAIHL